MPTPTRESAQSARGCTVQSVERVFLLLEHMTDNGGSASLTQLAALSGLPMPTIHRLVSTLTMLGYVRRQTSRRYSLGPRLVRIGEAAGRALGDWAHPSLVKLAKLTGETANLAILEGDAVTYIAQAPGVHSMRMFTEPGRRVSCHSTGVGKCLLAQLPEDNARGILARAGMPAQTDRTITDPDTLLMQLREIRTRGYALDDNEQEIGVRCVAAPVPAAAGQVALSISAPQGRMSEGDIARIVPVVQSVAAELSVALATSDQCA
jgi:IclR family acetate operon transcriptional repressor